MDKLTRDLKQKWKIMNEGLGDQVYDSRPTGKTMLGKIGAWLNNKIDDLMDGGRQIGSPKYNKQMVRNFLLKHTDENTVNTIEEIYTTSVMEAMNELGISDLARVEPDSGNFGDILFHNDAFTTHYEKMEALENKVREAINNATNG